MYTPMLISGREAIFEFLHLKLPAYWIIYKKDAFYICSVQDYDAFFTANENVELQEFLKLDSDISNGQ